MTIVVTPAVLWLTHEQKKLSVVAADAIFEDNRRGHNASALLTRVIRRTG